MKTIQILILSFVLILLSCQKVAKQNIYSQLYISVVAPNHKVVKTLIIDKQESSFKNINTNYNYNLPVFINGKCNLVVLKGLYIIEFTATAILEDNTEIPVRFLEHNIPIKAAKILNDKEYLQLQLSEL